ncbi:MAG: FG-GAP-like repeat-containing protein [Planctomycetota bacterium]
MRFWSRSCAASSLLVLCLLTACLGSVGGGGTERSVTQPGITIYVDQNNDAGMEDGTEEFPFTTIENGLQHAQKQDTVQVAAGTYVESFSLRADVDLIGAGSSKCILTAADGASQVVYAASGAGPETLFQGFTIADSAVVNGALFLQGTPTLRDIVVRGNREYVDEDSDGDAERFSSVAAVRIGNIADVKLTGLRIIDNDMNGISVTLPQGLITVTACLIACNNGDGVATQGRSDTLDPDLRLVNCTIAMNTLDGVYLDEYADAEIVNCIMYENAGHAVYESDRSGDPHVSYSDLVGGYFDTDTDSILSDAPSINALDPPGDNVGNRVQDPHFLDDEPPELDFTLQSDSPVIDAGDPDPEFDDRDGTRNDMGASGGPDGIDNLTSSGDFIGGSAYLRSRRGDTRYDAIARPIPWGLVETLERPETESADITGMEPLIEVDLTGDGRPEVLLRDARGAPWVMGEAGGGAAVRPLVDDSALIVPDEVWAVDIDRDGDLDLHLPGGVGAQRDALLMNDGAGHFRDVAQGRGLLGETPGRTVGWRDVDGDGDEDLLVETSEGTVVYVVAGRPGRGIVVVPTDRAIAGLRVDLDGDGDFMPPPEGLLLVLPGRASDEIVVGLGSVVTVGLEILYQDGSRALVPDVTPESVVYAAPR